MTWGVTGKTRLVALLGSPVAHSHSPAMQNAAFRAAGVDAVYLAFDVGVDQAAEAVKALRTLNVLGANVTMPLKRAVCDHLDALSPAASLSRAVNTIVNEGGRLIGHTTDGAGFLRSLDESGVAWAGSKMVLLGTGGAATAVAVEAALRGVKALRLFNARDAFWPAARALIERLAVLGCDVSLHALEETQALRQEVADADILVNGTPVGMEDGASQTPLPDPGVLRPGLVVADMIYVPERTALLQQAAAAGCRTVSGLGMQRWQGALSFGLWTGKEVPAAYPSGDFAPHGV